MNLGVIVETGLQSLPIIVCTIATSLIVSFVIHKLLKVPGKISTLVGVGSSICGGSAIAATAPVIDADDEEVAQAISVIFFYNVIAALLFPTLGKLLGFSMIDGNAFGILLEQQLMILHLLPQLLLPGIACGLLALQLLIKQ